MAPLSKECVEFNKKYLSDKEKTVMYVDIYEGRVYAPDDYKILDDTLVLVYGYAGIVSEKYNSISSFYFLFK